MRSLIEIKSLLIRHKWQHVTPGVDGLGAWIHKARGYGIIHSISTELDGEIWEHLSISRQDNKMPTWYEVKSIFHEVCGSDALGLIIVPPRSKHVDIAEVAHVWRCLSKRVTPDFTRGTGSI